MDVRVHNRVSQCCPATQHDTAAPAVLEPPAVLLDGLYMHNHPGSDLTKLSDVLLRP